MEQKEDGTSERDQAKALLLAKYGAGKTRLYEAPDGSLVGVRKPARGEYKRFIARTTNEKDDKESAMYELALACFVYPESDGKPNKAFAVSLFEEYAPFAGTLSAGALDLGGSKVEGETLKA